MSHRTVLTTRQRRALFDLPAERGVLLAHHVLSDDDLAVVHRRRRAKNRLGFALQLCAFRWPGRLIRPGEMIPEPMLAFVAAQVGATTEEVAAYAGRRATRYEHSTTLQALFGFQLFEGRVRREMLDWLVERAGAVPANVDLVTAFLEELRRRQIIVPGAPIVERLCADALAAAEKRAVTTIAARLDQRRRDRLMRLLDDNGDGASRLMWLRRCDAGANSADMHRLLDRLEVIEGLDLPPDLLDGIAPIRADRLRQQGERLFTAALRRLAPERRFAILGAAVAGWRARLTDALVETNDRLLGRVWREAERRRDEAVHEAHRSARETLRGLGAMGRGLMGAREAGEDLDAAVARGGGWDEVASLVASAEQLTGGAEPDAVDYIAPGHGLVRRYHRRFLAALDWQGAPGMQPLRTALAHLAKPASDDALPLDALRPRWSTRIPRADGTLDRPLWELAVMFELRAALRAGDIWLAGSLRYGEIERALLSMPAVHANAALAVPFDVDAWLADRRAAIAERAAAVGRAAASGDLANAELRDGRLQVRRQGSAVPEEAEALVTELYARMGPVRITELIREVDDAVGFTDAFTDLRKGAPAGDRDALMAVLLADGINIGVRKMADACPEFSYWELLRLATWHVRPETYHRALAMVVDAQTALPIAAHWGTGESASADGQHLRAGASGEALNVVNARYGHQPGAVAYTHVSDRFAPFHVQRIGATAHEAPYVLDGLLLHDSGLRIREQFTDTGGFTEHVFAVCSVLGCRFAPRIRGLAGHKLYPFDPGAMPEALVPLVGRRVNERIIRENWSDVLRAAASMAARRIVPSQYLRRLASFPKRNALAQAWREIGRIERTIFVLDWLLDEALQRRVQIGLNKGEAHHALKDAIHFHRKGELRDRSREDQELRIAAMNFLAAVIIFYNTRRLDAIVAAMAAEGVAPPPELLAHVSPLGWEHIVLTGEYTWKTPGQP